MLKYNVDVIIKTAIKNQAEEMGLHEYPCIMSSWVSGTNKMKQSMGSVLD